MMSVRLYITYLVLGLCLALPRPAAAQSTVVFNFDDGTPLLSRGQGIPLSQTSAGLTASFSSPSGPAYSVQSDASTGWRMSQFSGNYLYDNDLDRSILVIRFSSRINNISLTFATADFQIEVPSTIQLTAYMDSSTTVPVGVATAHGTYATDTMPMGTLSFDPHGPVFNLVEITMPFAAGGAATFFVDNIRVTPAPGITSVSAASFAPGVPLTAEMIVAGFGWGLASGTTNAPPTLPLPTSLEGTTVTLRDSAGVDRLCPLWLVSPGQINYYIPEGVQAGTATVTVANQSTVVVAGQVQIGTVSPGLFSMNSDGRGVAAAIAIWAKPDSSQTWQYVFAPGCVPGNCASNPLDMGAAGDRLYLALYGTGIRGRSGLSAVSAKLGGVDATVEYAGAVAGFMGLDQVNLAVPPSLAGRGEVDVLLTVDGLVSNSVKVNFK